MPVFVIYERLNIYTLAFSYCLTKSFIRLHIMNGLVLCAGANKTVGSLEFSKMRLQPLVKPRKREQLLLELVQKHRATWGKRLVAMKVAMHFFCCSHSPQNGNANSQYCIIAEGIANPIKWHAKNNCYLNDLCRNTFVPP